MKILADMAQRIVTLTTDFGTHDSYVAEVKAVLLAKHPDLTLVDITHEVPPYDVEAGAFQLLRSHLWFPPSTYHLAVVDPGVGTDRKPIYVQTRDFHFVGPDNGLLLWAVRACERRDGVAARWFEIPRAPGMKATFHGRDLFAPFVAMHLERPDSSFPELTEVEGREFPRHVIYEGAWIGQVVHIDRYGNLITSISLSDFENASAEVASLNGRIASVRSYLDIEQGTVGLIRGSHGYWEIAARMGSAAKLLGVKKGERVTVYPG